jgi:glycerophosphoryl diester phosphodiesterase
VFVNNVISHRGASAYAPENTWAAFHKANELGCKSIEFDVMLSRDGDVFVFHDNRVDRTTNGSGEFGELTSEYLKSLDAGSWFSSQFVGEKIPQFHEVLTWLWTENVQANIEIKPYPGTTEQTTSHVISQLLDLWPKDKPWPLISSFDHEALFLCQRLAPQLPLGLLMHRWEKNWLVKASALKCYSLNLNHRLLSKDRVQEIKQHDFKILVYTVNRKSLALNLLNWGVDAIFSDYPDLLDGVLEC